MKYQVICTKCGREYESGSNRNGVCPDCRQTRSQINTKYRNANYDSVQFYVPKGFRATLKNICAASGMSVNMFVNNAVEMYLNKLVEDKVIDEKLLMSLAPSDEDNESHSS